MPEQNDTGADDHQYSEQPDATNNIEQTWQKIKTVYNETVRSVLGRRKKKCKSWISTESWRKMEEGRWGEGGLREKKTTKT